MEAWKEIKGFEGLYEVSNTGRVRSVDRIVTSKNGRKLPCKGKKLFFTISKIDSKGHKPRARVQLWKNNNAYLLQVHRIVACAFVPNPGNKKTVNHIDGNPMNNHAGNLEWATHSENQKHAYDNGLTSVGINYYPSNSRKVKAYNETTGETITANSAHEMARVLSVCVSAVSNVCRKNRSEARYRCKGFALQYV